MRIITGQFKGRKLLDPIGRTTRPITHRVKVSLFDILTPWMPDAAVADLFSGTGSMGLESLSRGARHVWFAEKDRPALDRLKRNIETIGTGERSTIWPGDILRRLPSRLETLTDKLDVIFLDPPYVMAEAWLSGEDTPDVAAGRKLLTALNAALADDGLVVLRTAARCPEPPPVGALTCQRRAVYGTMALNFLGRE